VSGAAQPGGPWPTEPRPDYLTHTVDERDLTVDWFFGPRTFREKLPQLVLAIIGWIFTILPIVITVSAVTHQDGGGWWNYREGFVMFNLTIDILAILLAVFIAGYILLFLADRRADGWRKEHIAYDVERLDLRLAIAEDLYSGKFGPEEARLAQRDIRIEPESDFETYELRDRYRDYDVGVE
jgi:hypothetical protein